MYKRTKKREFTYRHARHLTRYSQKSSDELIAAFATSRNGLGREQARARLKKFGSNEVADHSQNSALKFLANAFHNPFNYLLSALAAVSYLTDDYRAAILMALMVAVSVSLTFLQELRSSKAAERLTAMVQTTVKVTRGSRKLEIPLAELVPGDIVTLASGDMIPADVRLLSAKNLTLSEAALTGESVPVEKTANVDPAPPAELLGLRNVCFMGTNVSSGAAQALVLHTGMETYFGSIAHSLRGARTDTSFDKGIQGFTKLMLKFMVVMVPLVFLINGLSKGNWSDAFLFAVAIAVGLTPEMLPMIVTGNLAKGALAMARHKVIVKRLNAIQNFGAMDVLCTDKTGTLTEDSVVYDGAYGPFGDRDEAVAHAAYLNSVFQNGLRNFLDLALIGHAEARGFSGLSKEHTFIDELPFDFTRKRMSVLVASPGGERTLICKGASEEVEALCGSVKTDQGVVPFDSVLRARCKETAAKLNAGGLRLIAIASRELKEGKAECQLKDEHDLTFLGYVAFLDPPAKESARAAIEALNRYGVEVKILTGDNEKATLKVAGEVGLDAGSVLLGRDIALLTDEELKRAAGSTKIFAKLAPDQKKRIIQALQSNGHVVGFIGDGINDAPALRAADVGISVSNAVDIAKESADIILLEKSLMVLEKGVIEGRKVFGNIVKYIKMGASSNFGNVFSMLGASFLLPFLPLRPIQLLTQNLLYDFSQIGIPFDRVDEEYLLKPRKWEIPGIRRFMMVIGPVSSIFDYATFALMWFYFHANHPALQGLFQTGWFVEGLLSQTLIVHLIRTDKIAFLQSRASLALTATTIAVMLGGLYLPFSPLGASLGFVPLPSAYFPWLLGILLSYCVVTQGMKSLLLRYLATAKAE